MIVIYQRERMSVLTHEVEMKVESRKSDIEFHTLVCNWIQTLLS